MVPQTVTTVMQTTTEREWVFSTIFDAELALHRPDDDDEGFVAAGRRCTRHFAAFYTARDIFRVGVEVIRHPDLEHNEQ